MVGRVKGLVRGAARRTLLASRRALMRVLRPVLMRIDTHLQWLFDRQQDDRARLTHMEQQVLALQKQVSALEWQLAARRSRAG